MCRDLEKLKDLLKIQKDSAYYDEYMRGMYNGMELARSVFEEKEPSYLEKPSNIKTVNDFIAFFTIKNNEVYRSPKDGKIYSFGYSIKKRIIHKFFSYIQWAFWKIGINFHNPIDGECTPDFSCCSKEK